MAEVVRYIDNRLTTGLNNGTSPANAFRTIEDCRAAIAGQTIDRVVFVAGSGPYREAFGSRTTRIKTDLSFLAADVSINSTSTNLATFGFAIGDIVQVFGSPLNSRQFQISSVAANKITFLASNKTYDEAAGAKVMVTTLNNGSNHAALDPAASGTVTRPLRYMLNGCEIDCGRTLNQEFGFMWVRSTANPGEWFVKRSDGSNPSLLQPFCAVIDGVFINDSADLDPDMGSVGSLSPTSPMGWGDNDTIGYSTVYVLSAVDPGTREIRVGQIASGVSINWQYLSFEDGIFTLGNRDSGNNVRKGCGIANASTAIWWVKRCIFKYQSSHGIEHASTGTTHVEACITYFSGHRGHYLNADGALRVYNCVDYGSHLFGLISSTVTGAGSLTIRNCISAYNEAGAIDKKSATAGLVEEYNIWYPRFGASGSALGYVSTARWTTTHPTDYPPAAATTINTSSANIAAGAVDPLFTNPSLTHVTPENFKVSAASLARYSGKMKLFIRDFGGRKFSVSHPSRGIWEFASGDSSGARTPRS